MPFTYSGDPSTSTLDEVRFLCRDTTAGHMVLSDEEIAYLLTKEANVYKAAASACELLSEVALSSKTVGDVSLTFSSEGYLKLAATLRKRGSTYAVPTAGGISHSESAAIRSDTDRYTPDFTRGQHDHPEAPGPR